MTRKGSTKLALVAGVLVGLLAAYRLGVFDRLGDPERLRGTLVELGPWGYLAFVLAYAALQPFGVPGTVFIVVSPLIWPWPVAFALSMAGTMAASVVGFSFARFIARDWVSTRIPARFRKYEDALERRGFTTVFVLRLVFWMPPLLHAFFGVSKVRFGTHFWGSLAGYVLPLLFCELLRVAGLRPAALGAAVGVDRRGGSDARHRSGDHLAPPKKPPARRGAGPRVVARRLLAPALPSGTPAGRRRNRQGRQERKEEEEKSRWILATLAPWRFLFLISTRRPPL
jgi:uncharacterized membrane protein YdjX (TVP38/TMEM64 family)